MDRKGKDRKGDGQEGNWVGRSWAGRGLGVRAGRRLNRKELDKGMSNLGAGISVTGAAPGHSRHKVTVAFGLGLWLVHAQCFSQSVIYLT